MKKKKESINANRIVHVDLGRLSEGLALTFKGVTEVFESLGADEVPGFGTVSTLEGETAPVEAVDDKVPEDKTPDDKTGKKSTKRDAADTVEDTPEGSQMTSEGVESAEVDNSEAKAKTASEEPNKAENDVAVEKDKAEKTDKASGSAFTLNDIMKIAAQKMAKDAKVTEKIGALVKTYGVATLKELPEEKFEAFMTDLTQI